MVTKINKIGFEIECEANYETQENFGIWGNVGSDGSIHTCSRGTHTGKLNDHDLNTVEFRSRPFLLSELESSDGPKGLFSMLEKQEKQGKFHWNETMGFHIHVSFTPLHIKPPELFSCEFNEFFINKLKSAYPEMFERRKNNKYCGADWDVDSIVNANNRYKAINYCSWNEWNTVEFRIFAADKAETMYEQLNFTIDTINEFLTLPISKKWHIKLRNSYKKSFSDTIEKKEKLIDLVTYIAKGRTEVYDLPTLVTNIKKINKYL